MKIEIFCLLVNKKYERNQKKIDIFYKNINLIKQSLWKNN